jgi:hypothetical protein
MSKITTTIPKKSRTQRRWTAQELRAMPAAQRDAILLAAAKRAEADYRSDRNLTAFEALAS